MTTVGLEKPANAPDDPVYDGLAEGRRWLWIVFWLFLALNIAGIVVMLFQMPSCEYAGFGDAEDCTERTRYLLIAGGTFISAFLLNFILFALALICSQLARIADRITPAPSS